MRHDDGEDIAKGNDVVVVVCHQSVRIIFGSVSSQFLNSVRVKRFGAFGSDRGSNRLSSLSALVVIVVEWYCCHDSPLPLRCVSVL
jgi:hypothetical protein